MSPWPRQIRPVPNNRSSCLETPADVAYRYRGLGRLRCRGGPTGTVAGTPLIAPHTGRGRFVDVAKRYIHGPWYPLRLFSMCPVLSKHVRALINAALLTPLRERAASILRADTQPAASQRLSPNRASSHAHARSNGVRMPFRLDQAIISERFITGSPMVALLETVSVSICPAHARVCRCNLCLHLSVDCGPIG